MNKILFFGLSLAVSSWLLGCGGDSGSPENSKESPALNHSQQNNHQKTSNEKIVGYVVDAPIVGLGYHCGQKSSTTDNDGKFVCDELPVTFSVGNLKIGSVSKNLFPKDKKIYPQDILGIKRSEVNDPQVIKLARFFQTLDDDGEYKKEIKITPDTAKQFQSNDLKNKEIATLTLNKIEGLVEYKLGVSLVPEDVAQKHLRINLVDGKKPVSIEFTKDSIDIPQGLDDTLTLQGIYKIDDKEIKSIIATGIKFTSSDPSVAKVDKNGKVTALKEGTSVITAKYGKLSTTADIRVTHTTLTKIEIQKPTLAQLTDLALGRDAIFSVKGYYSDNNLVKDVTQQVIFNSKSPLLSNMDNDNRIRAIGEGNASLLATLFDLTDKVDLEIKKSPIKKIKIFTPTRKVPVGMSIDAGIVGYYEDDSNTTTDESDKYLSNVSAWKVEGDVDAVKYIGKGELRPSSYYEKGIKTTSYLHDKYYVSNGLYAIKEGNITLKANYKNLHDAINIQIVPPKIYQLYIEKNYQLHEGESVKLNVTGRYTDGKEEDVSDQVIYQNLHPAIFTVKDGNITALKVGGGDLNIIYPSKDGNVTTNYHISVEPTRVYDITFWGIDRKISIGESYKLEPEIMGDYGSSIYQDITWESNDTKVATVNNDGNVTAKSEGSVQITVYYKKGTKDEKSASTSLNIYEPKLNYSIRYDFPMLYVGQSHELKINATLTPSYKHIDITKDISWSSSDPSIATVTSDGNVTGIKTGKVTIYAKYSGNQYKTDTNSTNIDIRVIKPYVYFNILDYEPVMQVGANYKFSIDSNIDIANDIVWTSSDPSIATVANDGTVTAKKAGTVSIKATYTGQYEVDGSREEEVSVDIYTKDSLGGM